MNERETYTATLTSNKRESNFWKIITETPKTGTECPDTWHARITSNTYLLRGNRDFLHSKVRTPAHLLGHRLEQRNGRLEWNQDPKTRNKSTAQWFTENCSKMKYCVLGTYFLGRHAKTEYDCFEHAMAMKHDIFEWTSVGPLALW